MDLPVAGFADEAGTAVVSSAGDDSGLAVAEGVVDGAASLLPTALVVTGVAEVDWARARGERENRNAAANIRRFIVVEGLPECRKIKASIYIDKDATRRAGVNFRNEIRNS